MRTAQLLLDDDSDDDEVEHHWKYELVLQSRLLDESFLEVDAVEDVMSDLLR